MLATKVILILALFHVALAQKQSCQSKIQSFYQSEDQYYDLECDRSNNNSKKGLLILSIPNNWVLIDLKAMWSEKIKSLFSFKIDLILATEGVISI